MKQGPENGGNINQVSWKDAFPKSLPSTGKLKSSSANPFGSEALNPNSVPQQADINGANANLNNPGTILASGNEYDASNSSTSNPYDDSRYESAVPPPNIEQNKDAANSVFADVAIPAIGSSSGN